METNPIVQRIAMPQGGQVRSGIVITVAIWVVTLGVSIPLSFAHHPLMDAIAPVLGPVLLGVLLLIPFIVAATAAQITHRDRTEHGIDPAPETWRAYTLAVLYRMRGLMIAIVGLAPLTIIILFYRAPEMPFEFVSLLEGGLLLLPFIGLLAVRPLLGVGLGVWCGLRLRARWLAVLAGPLLLLIVLGIELGLDRYQVVQGQPIYIGDTVEYPDVSDLQTAITILLALDGLSPLAVLALVLRRPK